MAKVELLGFRQLQDTLRKFPDEVQERALQTGMRKAAGKLRTAIRRAAYAKVAKGYKRTNKLRESIRSAVGKNAQNKGKAWVGLKKARGEPKIRFYYKTLEFGRKAYSSKRRGAVKASPPMKPFFVRTVAANQAATMQILITETQKAIATAAGRAYAKSRGAR